jgi:hypothetical protein
LAERFILTTSSGILRTFIPARFYTSVASPIPPAARLGGAWIAFMNWFEAYVNGLDHARER